jgi:hypothetical protein
MAAKKNSSKKNSSKSKPEVDWNDNLFDFKNKIAAGATMVGGAVSSGFKMADTFSREITGAAAIDRAIANPSKSNVGKAVIDVGSFLAPTSVASKAYSTAAASGKSALNFAIRNRKAADLSLNNWKPLAEMSNATFRAAEKARVAAENISLVKSYNKVSGLAVLPIVNALKNMMGSDPVSPKPVSPKPVARKSADSYGTPKNKKEETRKIKQRER